MIDSDPSSQDVAATYCATVVDEWVRSGVRHAVVCPGSRSTPMALALAANADLEVQVHHDERAGAFMALGVALTTRMPVAVLTTSGTAAVETHPAIVEASLSNVPLIVVTADRPPELAAVAAPQTIDQIKLFSNSVRYFDSPGVPDMAAQRSWRPRAARLVAESLGRTAAPGPVHLNLAFREPLVGQLLPLPPPRAADTAWVTQVRPSPNVDLRAFLAKIAGASRGLIVAGAERSLVSPETHVAAAAKVATLLGWPMMVDSRIAGRLGDLVERAELTVLSAADTVLADPEFANRFQPDAVLWLGAAPASKRTNEWLSRSPAPQIRVEPFGWSDPDSSLEMLIGVETTSFATALEAHFDELQVLKLDSADWKELWTRVEQTAQAALDGSLGDDDPLSEPTVARRVMSNLSTGSSLVVSSSMPVRDLEWFGRARGGLAVYSNRGANGIDGVIATSVGVAVGSKTPTCCLIGDIAFLHDATALVNATSRAIDLTIVVVDNRGGGIFSFLPQAANPGGTVFETLYGTPHGVRLDALAESLGATVIPVESVSDLELATRTSDGIRVVIVKTDRKANVAVHHELQMVVAEAVRSVT